MSDIKRIQELEEEIEDIEFEIAHHLVRLSKLYDEICSYGDELIRTEFFVWNDCPARSR